MVIHVAPDMLHVDIEPILEKTSEHELREQPEVEYNSDANFDDSRVVVVHEKSNPIDIENECLHVDSSIVSHLL
jgi:hypothetical protein